MTKLMQEMIKDPGATFEIEADLPSGNRMVGTVGPILNGRMCAHIGFSRGEPTPEDIQFATEVMNVAVGEPPALKRVTKGKAEYEAAQQDVRRFFGGGQG